MAPSPAIRLMTPADVPAAAAVGGAALSDLIPEDERPAGDAEWAEHLRRRELRTAHLRATDPGGAWVAELDGEIVGVALALIRDDVWGLSLFGVKPGLQGQGVGGPLLAAAVEYGAACRGGIILSSTDPRAMRSYFRSGFALKPAMAAAGPINRARIPGGLTSRPGDVAEHLATIEAASRSVRGATHAPDLGAFLDAGCELLVCDGRGFAMHREGSPAVLAATDEDAAADLLWSCLAGGPAGGTVHVDFITERNDWAIAVALEAGLALSPDGPVFVRGETGPFAPYLPSGAYL